MDRNLTDEELRDSEISRILYLVSRVIDEEIEKGNLKGCTLYAPCITDGPVVKTMNNILHEKADFMYYLQIEGTNNFMKEAMSLKPLVMELDDHLEHKDGKGITFKNGRQLLAVNCVTTEHDNKYFHIVIFLMKEVEDSEPDSELVS